MNDADQAGTRTIAIDLMPDDSAKTAPSQAELLPEDCADDLPNRATRLADGSIRLAFREPVTMVYRTTADGPETREIYAELTLHRLKGEDMRAIALASPENRSVVAIARSARVREGLMHRLFDRMDAEDVAAAGAVVAHFLGNGRRSAPSLTI